MQPRFLSSKCSPILKIFTSIHFSAQAQAGIITLLLTWYIDISRMQQMLCIMFWKKWLKCMHLRRNVMTARMLKYSVKYRLVWLQMRLWEINLHNMLNRWAQLVFCLCLTWAWTQGQFLYILRCPLKPASINKSYLCLCLWFGFENGLAKSIVWPNGVAYWVHITIFHAVSFSRLTMKWPWNMPHRVERVQNPKKKYILSHWILRTTSLTFKALCLFSDLFTNIHSYDFFFLQKLIWFEIERKHIIIVVIVKE